MNEPSFKVSAAKMRPLYSGAMCKILNLMSGELDAACTSSIEEMIRAAQMSYDPANEFLPWQDNCGVDRYLHTARGNLAEVVTIATLIDTGLNPKDIILHVDKHTQKMLNIDITATGYGTIQVKHATWGSGGELFVFENDMRGSPDYIMYVDYDHLKIRRISHCDVSAAIAVCKENEVYSGLQRAYVNDKRGYYLNNDCGFIKDIDLSPSVRSCIPC